MIKLISFNNFDSFDAKTNASFDGNEDLAQDFTAIFNVFSPPQPEAKIIPQSIKIINSDENRLFVKTPNQDQVFEQENTDIENDRILTFANENGEHKSLKTDLKIDNKLGFINHTSFLGKVDTTEQINKITPLSGFWEDINPAVIEKEKSSHYKNIPNFSEKSNLFENNERKTQADSIEIKEDDFLKFDRSEVKLSDLKIENEPIFQLEIPVEEHFSSSVNEQNSKLTEQFILNQENTLDLPEAKLSAKAIENKVEYPFLKIENQEIISLETSVRKDSEPLKSENPTIFETGEIDFSIKKENISAGKVLIEEDLNQFAKKFEPQDFAPEKLEVEDLRLDQSRIKTEITGLLDFDKIDVEIITEQIEEIEPKIIKLPETVKPELQTENEKIQSRFSNQTRNSNQDSTQNEKSNYLFDGETNRFEVVKSEENSEISSSNKTEIFKESNAKSNTENSVEKTYNVSKPLSKVLDVFLNERPKIKEITNQQISISEQNQQQTPESQLRDLSINSTIQNQILTTNTVANIKLRETLNKEVNESNGLNDQKEVLPNYENLPILDSTLNSQNDIQKPDFVSDRISSLQSEQNISKIMNNSVEKPTHKPLKPLNFSNEFSGLSFDKFLKSVSNEQKTVESVANSLFNSNAVFEQIEPKIIELAGFIQKSEEKHLLKMRLNPAELGEVEIKLEKDAAGKITAHIRTENESARHILAESLGQLRDSLQNSGWQVERLEVSCNPNQSSGNEHREKESRQNETERGNAFGFNGNVENEGETAENPADRLVNLRA